MTQTQTKHIIWSNINLDADDWKADIIAQWEEDGRGVPNDYQIYNEMIDTNNSYLDDERYNLRHITFEQQVVGIISLGRWNGRYSAYGLIDAGTSISNLLYSDCDYAEWYVEDGDFKKTAIHYDGRNYTTFRERKPDCDDEAWETMLEHIADDIIDEDEINTCTNPIGHYFSDYYGWCD